MNDFEISIPSDLPQWFKIMCYVGVLMLVICVARAAVGSDCLAAVLNRIRKFECGT